MKLKLVIVFLFCCILNATAQVVLQPLQVGAQQLPITGKDVASRQTAAAQTLPFFDDFSASGTLPNTAYWQSGGVLVNHRFGNAPISRMVATFDGLNAAGSAYQENAVGAGPSDTLTSQPLLLGGLQPSDSVYLSFYWQAGGLGDVPDFTKENSYYLQLEFKDANGVWHQVWRQNATGTSTPFRQTFVGVKDARFFHNDFQFRFRNIGDRRAMSDIWNIDYVELDRNRKKGQNKGQDFSISRGVSRLLKHYTAMPARHFLADPEAALNDSVWVSIHKLGTLGAINWRGYIKRAGAAQADTFLREQGIIGGNAFTVLSGKANVQKTPLPGEAFVLEHGFKLNTSEQSAKLRANDSTSRKTTFADYFAFDDGSAEAGFSFISAATSHIAQRVKLQQPDQVRGFMVYFPKVITLSNQSLVFKIWADEEGLPGRVLHQQSFQIQHSDSPDAFYEVLLTKAVHVDGSFYYGWTQPANAKVNIGFDRNEDGSAERLLWSNVTGWQTDSSTKGAVMMRPLMTGSALGIEDELPADNIKLYPNPTGGELNVEGEYRQLQVYDVLGRKVFDYRPQGSKSFVLPELPHGAYIVRIETSRSIITKKLIITR